MPSSLAPLQLRPQPWLWLAIAVWVVALGAGIAVLTSYSLQPGAAGDAPADWPAGLDRDDSRPSLVLFVHPQCPCSRATVGELMHVLTAAANPFTASAFVYAPADAVESWSNSDLAASLRELPGIRVQPDPDGRMAARFGAMTSGHVLLFDRAGRLQFSGGITGARGHAGNNAGRQAVLARIDGREQEFVKAGVFGCSIRDEAMTEDAP